MRISGYKQNTEGLAQHCRSRYNMGMMGLRLSKSKSGPATQTRIPTPLHAVAPEETVKDSTPARIEDQQGVIPREEGPYSLESPVVQTIETHHNDGGCCDALFDAYQEYIEESLAVSNHHGIMEDASSISQHTFGEEVERKHHVVCHVETVHSTNKGNGGHRVPRGGQTLPQLGRSYVDSMRKLVEMKRVDDRKKATGVTRRLMEEVHVAKENMCIYQRLVKISPSEDVSRTFHRKEFTKSRHLLDKMSRYECAPAYTLQNRAPWVDNF